MHIPVSEKIGIRIFPLTPAEQDIVQQRLHVVLSNLRILLQIPVRMKQGVGVRPGFFLLPEIVQQGVHTAGDCLRVGFQVPGDVEIGIGISPFADPVLEVMEQWIQPRGGHVRVFLQVPGSEEIGIGIFSLPCSCSHIVLNGVHGQLPDVGVLVKVPLGVQQWLPAQGVLEVFQLFPFATPATAKCGSDLEKVLFRRRAGWLATDVSLRPLYLDNRCHLPGAGLDHPAQAVDLFGPNNQCSVQVSNLRLLIGDNLVELMYECISLLQRCIQLMHLGITISHNQIKFMDPGIPICHRQIELVHPGVPICQHMLKRRNASHEFP